MKKAVILFMAFVLAAGFAMADDIGLTAGLEFGIENLNKANEGDSRPWIEPSISYYSNFLDGALDLNTKLGFYIGFTKYENESVPMGLYFDLGLTYSLYLSYASALSFTVENEIDKLMITNRPEDGSGINSTFLPAVNFGQDIDGIGNIYINLKFPIQYLTDYDKNADTTVNFNGILGWYSTFGLGLWIKEVYIMRPDKYSESGHYAIGAFASYGYGPFYAQAEASIYKDFDAYGMTLTPQIQFNIIDGLYFWVKCALEKLGSSQYDTAASPGIGISYSF